MSLDLRFDILVLCGGMLGAFGFRLARPAPNWTWGSISEVVASGCAMLVLIAIGPNELRQSMNLNPARTLAFSFLISFLAGAGLITMARALLFRYLPNNGSSQSGDLPAAPPLKKEAFHDH